MELELRQRLLPKAAQRTEIQGRLSQPARKSQGSRTNRSQRAKNEAKAKVKEERSQRASQEPTQGLVGGGFSVTIQKTNKDQGWCLGPEQDEMS